MDQCENGCGRQVPRVSKTMICDVCRDLKRRELGIPKYVDFMLGHRRPARQYRRHFAERNRGEGFTSSLGTPEDFAHAVVRVSPQRGRGMRSVDDEPSE